jgi:hypothetical protein
MDLIRALTLRPNPARTRCMERCIKEERESILPNGKGNFHSIVSAKSRASAKSRSKAGGGRKSRRTNRRSRKSRK